MVPMRDKGKVDTPENMLYLIKFTLGQAHMHTWTILGLRV
jgi:hypothetical protein